MVFFSITKKQKLFFCRKTKLIECHVRPNLRKTLFLKKQSFCALFFLPNFFQDFSASPIPLSRHRALFLHAPVTLDMAGDYTCKVSTLQNEVQATARLVVYGERLSRDVRAQGKTGQMRNLFLGGTVYGISRGTPEFFLLYRGRPLSYSLDWGGRKLRTKTFKSRNELSANQADVFHLSVFVLPKTLEMPKKYLRKLRG